MSKTEALTISFGAKFTKYNYMNKKSKGTVELIILHVIKHSL